MSSTEELDQLREGLCRVMKPEAIGSWLETPNKAFDGLKPIEVIEQGQIARIWRMIYEMEMNTAF